MHGSGVQQAQEELLPAEAAWRHEATKQEIGASGK